MKPATCKTCGKLFEYHISKKGLYCSRVCLGKSQQKRIICSCDFCGKELIKTPSELKKSNGGHFCNTSCSAKFNNKHRRRNKWSIEQRSKVKENNIKLGRKGPDSYNLICKICKNSFVHKRKDKITCSSKCYHEAVVGQGKTTWNLNKNSLHRKIGRSYNEMKLYEMIKNKWPDAKHNLFIFNGFDADIIIPTLKLAIHWNGIWHYKQIINEQHFCNIISRDKMRYEEIERCGYTNYIIKDIKSRKDYNLVNSEFDKLTQYIDSLVGDSAFKSDSTPYREAALSHELISK